MSWDRLAPVQVESSLDQSGKNAQNLTTAFTADVLPKVNVYEIYHMVVTSGPPLAVARIVVIGKFWSFVTLDINGGNEWDPSQPLIMHAGSDMYFLWNIPVASSSPPPLVTAWPRFDPDHPQNRQVLTA